MCYIDEAEAEPAYRAIEQFFEKTRLALHPNPVPDTWFETLMYQNVCKFGDQLSDDKLHQLRYHDQVIAAVTQTKNEMNWVRFDFFRADLESVVVKNVKC